MKKIISFFGEVRTEMLKVTWPTREELIGSTWVVLITMAILSLFVGCTDFIFANLLKLFLR